MNNSKRQFLKFIAWSTALISLATEASLTYSKDSSDQSKEVSQSEIGGGMTGVDFSRYYKPTKTDGSSIDG